MKQQPTYTQLRQAMGAMIDLFETAMYLPKSFSNEIRLLRCRLVAHQLQLGELPVLAKDPILEKTTYIGRRAKPSQRLWRDPRTRG